MFEASVATGDDLLSLPKIASRLSMPAQTLYAWADKGLITGHPCGRGKVYSLAQVQALRSRPGYVPLPEAAERINVTQSRLRGWETHGRIPALLRVSERRCGLNEADIPRIRAWYMWGWRTVLRRSDYPALYDLYPAQRSVIGFEKAIADGAIPERFSAAHYDIRGWRFEERMPDQLEG